MVGWYNPLNPLRAGHPARPLRPVHGGTLTVRWYRSVNEGQRQRKPGRRPWGVALWLCVLPTLMVICGCEGGGNILGQGDNSGNLVAGEGGGTGGGGGGADDRNFTVFALTLVGNNLLRFNSSSPGSIQSRTVITGLPTGERIVGIDFGLKTTSGTIKEALYAVGNFSGLYEIDTTTGAATPVSTAPLAVSLNGTEFGVLASGNVNVVSDAGQNMAISTSDGQVIDQDFETPGTQPGQPLAYAAGDANAGRSPRVVGLAEESVTAGRIAERFGIDSALDILVRQGSANTQPKVAPSSGQLFTIGALGGDTGDVVGFDIVSATEISAGGQITTTFFAFAALAPPGAASSTLVRIDLNTGAARTIGTIGGGELVNSLAVPLGL